MARDPEATRARVLDAAATLFAERGYAGTKMRDIAARAGANLASGHYHWGSKKALYLAVFRQHFANTRAELQRRGATGSPEELARMSRPDLERMLRARVKVMLDILIGPPPGIHGTLMQREMCDPSEALPVIVGEFVKPMMQEMEAIVAALEPTLDPAAVELCSRSIAGQALFYRFAMPGVLRMEGRRSYPRGRADELADHITAFSLGGLGRRRDDEGRSSRGR
jgi:AcrR family transcriptional regulator